MNSDRLRHVQAIVATENVEVSDHAYEFMIARLIDIEDIIAQVGTAVLVEDYRDTRGENRILVRQVTDGNCFVHVVWELPQESDEPVILVTAYWPDAAIWSKDAMTRL